MCISFKAERGARGLIGKEKNRSQYQSTGGLLSVSQPLFDGDTRMRYVRWEIGTADGLDNWLILHIICEANS
ncbi:hypothetical protein ASF70_02225 [Rhizobium sp. Leaf321]|nr:hypothetical protein ASF70_02225 [Rhizobium sp. Leaf321]